LQLHELDLLNDPWDFAEGAAGAIVNVHFFLPSLFSRFGHSLKPGGYLIFESVPGCGGNYRELRLASYVRSRLQQDATVELSRP